MTAILDFAGIFVIVLFATSFIKIITTLSIFRYGLGLSGFLFGLVVFAFSLVLTFFVMNPIVAPAGGWEAIVNNSNVNWKSVQTTFEPFVKKNTEQDTIEKLKEISLKLEPTQDPEQLENAWPVYLTAFMITELKEAFYLGLVLIIPFLLIDLLIVNLLAALNINQISATLVSLPVKLLLFYVVDGWQLLSEKVLMQYV